MFEWFLLTEPDLNEIRGIADQESKHNLLCFGSSFSFHFFFQTFSSILFSLFLFLFLLLWLVVAALWQCKSLFQQFLFFAPSRFSLWFSRRLISTLLSPYNLYHFSSVSFNSFLFFLLRFVFAVLIEWLLVDRFVY